MPIVYLNFRVLPLEQQLPMVWAEGTFVARRWKAGQPIALYLMQGHFLCEVYLKQGESSVLKVHAFTTTDTKRLEEYLCYIQLHDLDD